MLLHIMASSHLFADPGIKSWLLRRSGAFSVYREGVDRQAITAAVAVLQEAKRPLVIFPEGVITPSNGRLGNLMDGTAFIAEMRPRSVQETPAARWSFIQWRCDISSGATSTSPLEPPWMRSNAGFHGGRCDKCR